MALPSAGGIGDALSGIGDKLSSFKNSTVETLDKYRGDAVKAISPVQNKLKEGVATLKAGEAKVSGTISAYKDEVISGLDSIVGSLTGGALDFKDAAQYFSVGKNGVSFNKDMLVQSIGNKIGFDISSKDALMYQLSDMANSEFNNLTGGYFGNMVDSTGGGFRITKNWRDQMGGGILSLLGRTTGLNTLTDYTFNTSYYNSLMKMTAQYGMSDSYQSIMDKYNNPEDAEAALLNAIPQMMQNGDLVSMNKVLDLVSAKSHAMINAKYPGLANNLFQNFVLDNGTSPGQYPAIKAMFLRVVTTIFGDNWYKTNSMFGQVLNMGLISSVSEDMKQVLISDDTAPELVVLMACTGMFNEQSAVDTFKNSFPDVPIIATA